MSIVDFLSVVTFGLTCFELGVAYARGHNKKR